jgi:dUTP pyrophosphatase
MRVRVLFKRFDPTQPALRSGYPGDAGTDLLAAVGLTVGPGETARVATNLALALPEGYYGLVTGRSGLAAQGILVHQGTVDQGYRGRIDVVLTNLGQQPFAVAPGDRIAQLIVLAFAAPAFEEVDELPPSPRGAQGFGSSGLR